jgi:hypothetical protein
MEDHIQSLIGTHTGLQHSLPRIGHTEPVSGEAGEGGLIQAPVLVEMYYRIIK